MDGWGTVHFFPHWIRIRCIMISSINQRKLLIIIQSESFENFFSNLIGDSPLSSIEFFEDLGDDYNLERTWDIPDQWIWKFQSHQDLEDLINDYNLSKDDLKYI